jgi:hypothetical protein
MRGFGGAGERRGLKELEATSGGVPGFGPVRNSLASLSDEVSVHLVGAREDRQEVSDGVYQLARCSGLVLEDLGLSPSGGVLVE